MMAAFVLFVWAATLLQLAGVSAMAARVMPPRIAYGLMMPGAAIWCMIAIARADWPLLTMQAVFLVTNIVGFLQWGRQ